MIKKHFSNIENTIGRKIIGLDILSTDEFITQATSIV